MRETVLLFNIKDKKRAQELQMICMSLRIRVRLIKKEEYFQTVGVLAGMKEASETDRIYEGDRQPSGSDFIYDAKEGYETY